MAEVTDVRAPAPPGDPRPLVPARRVPSDLGRKVLAFEFVVLAEYWVAPVFLGVTNYAGIWSEIGSALFFVLVGSLLVFVLVPLIPHLRAALGSWKRRLVFHGVWATSLTVGMFVTNILQFVDGPTSGPILLGQETVYTPLGAWSSLTVYLPGVQLWATFNPEGPTVLFLLGFLSAASIVLGPMRRPAACPTPSPKSTGRKSPLASLGALAPLGFITGCPACSPAYFALLSLLVPGAAVGAYAALPLVPWIGFAGLLFLVGFWLAVRLIERSTSPPTTARLAAIPVG